MSDQIFTVFNLIKIFTVATLSFFVAIILTPWWLKILRRYFSSGKQIAKTGAPIASSLHKNKEGTPTMGGVVVWLTAALLTVVFWILSKTIGGFWSDLSFLSRGQTLLPLGFLLLAGLVGMADDLIGIFRRRGLAMRHRLLLYLMVAVLGAWWFYFKLDWSIVNIPFLGDFDIGWWYVPVFLLVIVATAFSANETDGLDGLVGGVFLTSFLALGAIAFVQGRTDLVVFIASIVGALVAFLWFNIYPAKFFMGDTGVMSLG